MRRLVIVVLTLLGVLFLTITATTQETFLTKIDIKSQEDISTLASLSINVYAKTSKFFLAEMDRNQMDLLNKEGISFQVVDDEPIPGLYYFVYAKGNEDIEPYLSQIETKAEVLIWEDSWALIKGDRFKIEELPLLGFGLRKIFHKPLPIKVEKEVPSALQSLVPTYNALVDSMVSRVTTEETTGWVRFLSGEDSVDIGGEDYLIATRYSYSEGCSKAGQYIKERFDSLGLAAEYHHFNLSSFSGLLYDIISTPDGQKAWAVLHRGILKTTDSGSTWNLIDGTETYDLYEVVVPHEDTLYAVGHHGIILKSTDGGDNWSELSSGTSEVLWGAYFESPTYGWAVGEHGTVLYTSSGGASWNVQSTPTDYGLHSVDFVDSDNGWIVGAFGTILHTTDRGVSWDTQAGGVPQFLYGLDFMTSTKGCIVGQAGKILRTTDAGATWDTIPCGTTEDLKSVCFVDSIHGWIAGAGCSVLYTMDGGESWEFRASPTGYRQRCSLHGIHFVDTLRGWVGGANSLDFSTNGGESWITQFMNINPYPLKNVVATLPGMEGVSGEYLITAHYDDVSQWPMTLAPGADDNASGCAAVLTAASILRDYQFKYTIKFVTFPGEEQGLWGSHFYAQDAYNRGDTILGVLNFDMIAYDGNDDEIVEIHTGTRAASIILGNVLIGTFSDYGIDLDPEVIISDATDRSDHASFWEFGYPAILGIEDFDDFNPRYHKSSDRITSFDIPYFVDFCKASVAALATLAEPFLMGDANGDGGIDIVDVVFLINFLFKTGDPPDPIIAGDVNCDGEENVVDVVYLVNYLFKSGPPPCAGT